MTNKLKIAFGMIVFNSDYVLKQCLESVYPYATQILIAEGPVSFWQNQGYTTSTDRTNEILNSFPDPENKITIIHSMYSEKDAQCNAYMKHIRDDIDYVWNLDADEIFKGEDIEKLSKLLKEEQYTSVGIKSRTFYGGADRYITGFEENKDNFLRVFKVTPGCIWETHRPPTIKYPDNIEKKHLDSDSLYEKTGILMYHYSYVFPKQVYKKMEYYMAIGGMGNRIQNYFFNVYWPWIIGNHEKRKLIEDQYLGVHEYLPEGRGPSFTTPFIGNHPEAIENSMDEMKGIFKKEMEYVIDKLK